MVIIEETGFGYIVVDGKRFERDIIICNDEISFRPKELSRKYAEKYGHTPLSAEELLFLLDKCNDVEIVVIGSGQYGALPVMDNVVNELIKRGLEYIIKPTPQVVSLVNESSKKKRRYLAILHLTC